MCSRLLIGSASMPSSASRPVAVAPMRSRSSSASARSARRRGERARASRPAGRRRCPACRWRSRPRRAGAGCARRPGPSRRAPCSTARPALRRSRRARRRPCARVVLVDPGPEVLRAQRREGEQQVAEVALGIDHDRRARRRSRPPRCSAEAQPGLAAAGHADADGVRRQVLRVVEDVAVLQRLGLDVVRLAEVEAPKSFDLVHGASLRSVAAQV